MRRFAFVVHPLRFDDFARKYRITRYLPPALVEAGMKHVPPMVAGHVTGVRSAATGEGLEGWLIGLPLTPKVLMESPYPWVLEKLTAAGRLAERLGAEIVGLGAFTKIAGDRGVTLAERLSIPVTSGNSYTTATAVEGALTAARALGIEPGEATVAVLGATGSIGKAAALTLAGQAGRLVLAARRQDALQALQDQCLLAGQRQVEVTASIPAAVARADVVLAVTAAQDAIVDAADLKPGSVFCDVARPRTLSRVVNQQRPDVLVIDGGVIAVPGDHPDMGLDFGFPPGMVEACMAETMILALAGRLENFTLGAEIAPERVAEIHRLGAEHGFHLAGFRRFERAVDADEVARIRDAARLTNPSGGGPG